MTTVVATPAIRATIQRCQTLFNPCAFVTTQENQYFLVPCFTLDTTQDPPILKPIDMQQSPIPAFLLPPDLLQKTYTLDQQYGYDIIVNATYVYPNQDLAPHVPKAGQALDCDECSCRINDQLSLLEIVREITKESQSPEKQPLERLAELIQFCALQALGGPSRSSSTQPKRSNSSLTPTISPAHSHPSSRAPSRSVPCADDRKSPTGSFTPINSA